MCRTKTRRDFASGAPSIAEAETLPVIIFFDALDARVHEDDAKKKDLLYFEYGQIRFDGATLCEGARKMETSVEPSVAAATEGADARRGEYAIEAVRVKDHALIRIDDGEKTVQCIVAMPDTTRFCYISLGGTHCTIRDIRIDYGEPWLQHHIRAFSAAYNASAYYDYYADDLLPILEKKPAFLFDLNLALLEKLLVLLDLSVPVALTERYEPGLPGDVLDGRARIQPKYKGESLLADYGREQAYYQVFVNRIPGQAGDDGASTFIPNLSILDLLSAEGPDAGKYLL